MLPYYCPTFDGYQVVLGLDRASRMPSYINRSEANSGRNFRPF